MYNISEKKAFLKERLSKKRFNHSVNVAEESRILAELYGEDPEKAFFAGLLHDICKEEDAEVQRQMAEKSGLSVLREELESRPLLHGIAGAYFVKTEFGIKDIDIINAIRFHTVGRAGMSKLEEIVYLADLVSADRDYKDVDKMRKIVHTDLDSAMLEGLKFSLESVLKKGGYIPMYTLEGYNFYTRLKKNKNI
ncbi:MAG TPA: bis(5'-nucleosyl)-tetraphosphatase (symmetrical) YqeK [Ruminococcus sp.]|nr:bis(5'-nucleosyl)-tetraphosphatase (symmetrical) YqeK [Ruminococcus sp.]MDY3843931.1 bis(5'-nucleosyl)-tetraphosphatase (symmetrical) YqeK [Ruminococcus sp.]CDF02330.1 hydrolase HD family [Ruminococcus sp. CAG:624]